MVLQLVASRYVFATDRDIRPAEKLVGRLERVLAHGRVGIGVRPARSLWHAALNTSWAVTRARGSFGHRIGIQSGIRAESGFGTDAGPGADADAGPGRVHHLGNKQVFRPASRRTLAPCPPPRLGTRRARVRTRRYLWTVQAPRPARTVAVLNHLRADASYA